MFVYRNIDIIDFAWTFYYNEESGGQFYWSRIENLEIKGDSKFEKSSYGDDDWAPISRDFDQLRPNEELLEECF